MLKCIAEDLLSFCDVHQLSVMYTWFKKKACLYGTYSHPATKCNLIDFMLLHMF